MTALVAAVATVLGLAVGSFLNVVIHRVPAGVSLVRPPSACPECGHRIRARDNVPLLGWLALRGRCRDCGARIPVRYPLVELAGGLAFLLVALCLAPGGWLAPPTATGAAVVAQLLVLAVHLWLAAASIALAIIDLDVRRLPNRIVLPTLGVVLVLLAVAAALLGDWGALLRAIAGGAILAVVYLVLALVSRGGMGMGDVKLAAPLGVAMAWTGWPALLVGAFAAFLLGGLVGVALLITRRAGRRSAIPFGPWMIAGAWIGILAGPAAWSWYTAVAGLG